MATAVSMSVTGNNEVDGLLSGVKWSGALTYSMPTVRYGDATSASYTFAAITTPEQQAAINWALTEIQGFTNINLSNAGTSTSADIRFGNSSVANPTAYAYYPGSGSGGDVWIGMQYDYQHPTLGSYEWVTHIHEIGHAFGLKHPHDTSGGFPALSLAHDDLEYSVMSYRSYIGGSISGGYTNEDYGFPQTYMMNDIAALQAMYGADFGLNNTDTVYTWDPNTGQMAIDGAGQGAPGANRVFLTIWDGNGNDTYDMSNYGGGVSIDLRPGSFSITSSVQKAYLGVGHYAQGNVYNAYQYNGDARSLIENAIGGGGNDTIIGNAAGNRITGGAGDDIFTFYGAGGGDVITDFTAGAGGIDEIYLFGFSTIHSFTEALSAASQVGQDTVFNFGAGATLTLEDVVLGNLTSGDFKFTGYNIVGTTGNDLIDASHSPAGQHLPTDGDDTISGLAGDDTIYGLDGNDKITGGAGNDQLFGGLGDDTFVVAKGDALGDTLDGGDGIDTIQVTGKDNIKLISFGPSNSIESWIGSNKAVVGNGGNNVFDFSGLTSISGLSYVDGGAGNDTLTGTAFADDLRGGKGSDRLTGGAGDDKLSGGDAADTFVFGENFGHDRISGFAAGTSSSHDVIEFDMTVFANFADVMSHAAQAATNVVITDVDGNTLTLQSMTLAKLVAADFHFV